MIYTVRITVGRENSAIDNLATRVKNLKLGIKSLFHPGEIKGYLFVEGELGDIEKSISGVPHIRGIIKKAVPFEQIKKFLEAKKLDIRVNKGDIVEIIGGPFKNEKGKVTRVDESKEEITVELLEAAIPIPITVSFDAIRVLKSTAKPPEEKDDGLDAMLEDKKEDVVIEEKVKEVKEKVEDMAEEAKEKVKDAVEEVKDDVEKVVEEVEEAVEKKDDEKKSEDKKDEEKKE
jgi:transcription termination/antitermination protein NusG